MPKLYNRIWKFQVGNLDVSHLDGIFQIKRSLRRQTNTCDLRIYNLTAEHVAQLRNENELFVEVRAGYEVDGEPTILFRGNAREQASVSTEKTEIILDVTARDGGTSNFRRINRSYDPGTPLRTVLTDLTNEMGIGIGNLNDFINERLTTSSQDRFTQGVVASGPAYRLLDRIIRSQGLRWSIQNGNLQILRQRRTRINVGKLITSRTGLLGSPTRDKDGKVQCKVFIQSGLEPGNNIRLESRLIEGDYEIQETTYKGSTFGSNSDWVADLVLKPLESRT